jgi:hypothetical protein
MWRVILPVAHPLLAGFDELTGLGGVFVLDCEQQGFLF